MSRRAAPPLSRAPKQPPEAIRSALVRPAKDASQSEIHAYIQGRDFEDMARKELRLAKEVREAEGARMRKSRGSRLDNPEQDKSYQSVRMPSGVCALYRPVLVTHADRHEVGLRLKFALPALSVELASIGPESLPTDWTDYTSNAKFGDEGILITDGAEEMSLVVLAENLGEIELGIDWFWCRKLNCSDEIPAGWDPYQVVYDTTSRQ